MNNREAAVKIFEDGYFIPGSKFDNDPSVFTENGKVIPNAFSEDDKEKIITEIEKALNRLENGDYEEIIF